MKEQRVIYYRNELEDEFSSAVINPRIIDENYSYMGGFGRKIARGLLYHVIAKPLGTVFLKLKYGHRIVNREVFKEADGMGYFLYGNHTNAAADPFIPQRVDVSKSVYIIVHPANVSMPVFGHVTPVLGALPLPDTLPAAKTFNKTVKDIVSKGKCITIYPEAHIWPYYTKIRPFKSASFGYPVQCGVPVFCFTNTYVKRKYLKTPRIVTYVDGPFYADKSLSKAEQKEYLRNKVYDTMTERSKNSNIEVIKYVKSEE